VKEQNTPFRTFITEQEALDVCELLIQKGIQVKLKNSLEQKDVPNLIQVGHVTYEVYVAQEDQQDAEELLQSNQISDEPKEDYYLSQFNKEELLNVLIDARDWSEFDVNLAEKILIERGENIDLKFIETERQKRIDAMKKFDKMPIFQITLGYILGFAFAPVAIIIGYAIYVDKKVLPDGSKMFRYSNYDRGNGIFIIVISCIMIAFYFYYFFFGIK